MLPEGLFLVRHCSLATLRNGPPYHNMRLDEQASTQAVGSNSMNEDRKNDWTLFVWHRHAAEAENLARLTAALAPRVLAELVNEAGSLCRLHNGELVPVSREDMRNIVTKHIRTPVVITRDNGAGTTREMAFEPFAFPMAGSKQDIGHQPNDRVLTALQDALIPLVARAPTPPIAFQPGQLELIRNRLKTGEPAVMVAAAFHAEPEQIRSIGIAAGIHVH
jgi:hypothetical protein